MRKATEPFTYALATKSDNKFRRQTNQSINNATAFYLEWSSGNLQNLQKIPNILDFVEFPQPTNANMRPIKITLQELQSEKDLNPRVKEK